MFWRKNTDALSVPTRLHEAQLGVARRAASEENDLVIGAVSGYVWPDVQYWVNSLERSDYRGRRVVVAYEAAFETVDAFLDRGFDVVTFAEKGRRFVYPRKGFRHEDTSINRFYQVWRFLQSQAEPFRFVVAVDVRDVVFQRDPAEWLDEHLGEKKLNVGSEGARVDEEPWNSEVILESYGPVIHRSVGERELFNAGTIAGTGEALRDFTLNVYLCSRSNAVPYTDQAALNLLLSLDAYRPITRFNGPDEDWACQAATVAPDSEYLAASRPSAPNWSPTFDGERVCTPDGSPYCIVHQYDRVPAWKDRLQALYAD